MFPAIASVGEQMEIRALVVGSKTSSLRREVAAGQVQGRNELIINDDYGPDEARTNGKCQWKPRCGVGFGADGGSKFWCAGVGVSVGEGEGGVLGVSRREQMSGRCL